MKASGLVKEMLADADEDEISLPEVSTMDFTKIVDFLVRGWVWKGAPLLIALFCVSVRVFCRLFVCPAVLLSLCPCAGVHGVGVVLRA